MLVTMQVGQKVTNTVAFFDANGNPTTIVDAPPFWSVADTTIATIDQTGLITAVAPGTTTYTIADTAGGVALTGSPITLTVAAIPPPPPGPATTFVITPGTPA